jgi:hypothetical protein
MPAATVYNCRDKRTTALPNPELLSAPCVVLPERQKLEEGSKGASKVIESIANKFVQSLGVVGQRNGQTLVTFGTCSCHPRMNYPLRSSGSMVGLLLCSSQCAYRSELPD